MSRSSIRYRFARPCRRGDSKDCQRKQMPAWHVIQNAGHVQQKHTGTTRGNIDDDVSVLVWQQAPESSSAERAIQATSTPTRTFTSIVRWPISLTHVT